MDNFVILSGCFGGGKSTLLAALRNRDFPTLEEPGRRVVQHQLKMNGQALPWLDLEAFLHEAIELAEDDYESALPRSGPVFFDRSLIDAASALRHLGQHKWFEIMRNDFRYCRKVFLAPPWPEIYVTDAERQHGLNAAIEEYDRLLRDFGELDYDVVILPKVSVEERTAFILDKLEIR